MVGEILQTLSEKDRKPSPCIECSENPFTIERSLCVPRCVKWKRWLKEVFENDLYEKEHRPKEEIIWNRPDLLGQEGDKGRIDRPYNTSHSNNLQDDRGHGGFYTTDYRWADLLGIDELDGESS